MAKLRSVNTKFWDDNYIITLKPIEKLLFLYFLTNPLTDICGAYEISLARISFDTSIPFELLNTILKKFSDEKKVIYRDGWLVLPNFIKNQSLNPNMKDGIKKTLISMPKWIVKIIGFESLPKGYPTLPKDSRSNLIESNITKPNAASGKGTGFKNLGTKGTGEQKWQKAGDVLKKKFGTS